MLKLNSPQKLWGVAHGSIGITRQLFTDELFVFRSAAQDYIDKARVDNRIAPMLPIDPMVPVHTFWDVGRADLTAIWMMQKVGAQYRFVGYYEERGEEYILNVGGNRLAPTQEQR